MALLPLPLRHYYERGLRKIERTPSGIQGPGTEDLTLAYVAGKSLRDERAREEAQGRELAEMRLAEINRQAGESLALRRDVLGDLKTQNKWATGIGLINLGIEGMGGYARLKQVERRERIDTLLAKHAVEMVDLKKVLYTDLMDILKKQKLLLSTQ